MKAIILAAGRGSRMKDLTEDRPKCLVELHGRPLLYWQLDALNGAGIDEIALVTGYKRELLSDSNLVEFHNARWAETNMVSSLCCAETWLESETCIVSYSDIFYKSTAIDLLIKSNAMLSITYDPNWLTLWKKRFKDPLVDAETFSFDAKGALVDIGNKPNALSEVKGQYMGLLKFTPTSWAEVTRICKKIPPRKYDLLDMTSLLQKVVQAGRIAVHTIPYELAWGEVDSAEDLIVYKKIDFGVKF